MFRNCADVSFRNSWVYLSLDQKEKSIIVTAERRHIHHVRCITSSTSMFVNKLVEHVLGKVLKPQILVDAGNEQHSYCKLENLWEALDEQRSTIQVVTRQGQGRTVSVELFSAFKNEDIVVSGESGDLKLDSNDTLRFDCFWHMNDLSIRKQNALGCG